MFHNVKGKRLLAMGLVAVMTVSAAFIPSATSEAASGKKVKGITLKIGSKKVTKKTYKVSKGKKVAIKVTVKPGKAKKKVVFKSNKKSVATVSKKGKVTAKKAGTAKITVTVTGKNNKKKTTWVKIKVTGRETNMADNSTPTPSPTATPDATPTPKPPLTIEPPKPATPQNNNVKIEELRISNGENTIYGKIYKPLEKGTYPAVILSHGYNGTNRDFVTECRLYAENGIIAYAYDFCGGSGASQSTGASTDMTIFTEKSDLLAVFNHISQMKDVDASNIFLFGGSQGGLVTTLAAEELGDKVKAMALYFPALCIPDNWRDTYPEPEKAPETFDFWGLKLGKNFVTSIHDFKVFETIGSYENDVIILHGDKDAIVPLSYSERAVAQYKNAELITMPGEGHGFAPVAAKTAREKVLAFMLEHIK